MDIAFGFDPGGIDEFGWAVLECPPYDLPHIRAAGTVDHAEEAVSAATSRLRSEDQVIAAGIDSPMYWTPTGERQAESIVRDAMRSRGAPNVGGTVQHPNSLRGACVVQGPTTALLLRERFRDIQITESHPKALVWLLGIASKDRQPRELLPRDFAKLFRCSYSGEHERDAALAAWSAQSMASRRVGWTNLVERERAPLFIAGAVGYWLPLAAS
jgi:hypothetical protein